MAGIPTPGVSTPVFQSWAASVAAEMNQPPGIIATYASFQAATGGPFALGVPTTKVREIYPYANASNGRFTVPGTLDGLYFCQISGQFAAVAGGLQRFLGLRFNGSVTEGTAAAQLGAGGNVNIGFSTVKLLAGGAYMEGLYYQDSGTGIQVTGMQMSLIRLSAIG